MGQGAVRWGGARRRASWNALSPPSTSVHALKPSCIGKPSLMSVSGVVLFTSRGLRVQPSNASLEARVVDCELAQHAASADYVWLTFCLDKGTFCTRSATIRKLYSMDRPMPRAKTRPHPYDFDVFVARSPVFTLEELAAARGGCQAA